LVRDLKPPELSSAESLLPLSLSFCIAGFCEWRLQDRR